MDFTTPPGLGQYAFAYAKRFRWRVFPLVPAQKNPLIGDWQLLGPPSAQQVTQWWHRWPNANIGLLCGQGSGVVVADVDPRNGGDSTWAEWLDLHGRPNTLEALSGRGEGGHYFFQAADTPLAKTKLGPGVDGLGERSYVILSPSLHPESGRPYEWIPEGIPPGPLPAWLLERWPKAEPTTQPNQAPGRFQPHAGRPLPEEVQGQLVAFLAGSGLVLQRDERYRGRCPFPHLGTGDCECPASFYVSPVTGRWTCFCQDHPGAAQRSNASGGPNALLALVGIPLQRQSSGRSRQMLNWEVRG